MEKLSQTDSAERMRGLLQDLVCELVDRPNEVTVMTTLSDGGSTVVLTVRTANGEVGKVIGKQGRNAQAIRLLLEAIAAKYRQHVVLEIDDGRKRRRNDGHRGANMGRR